MPQLPQDKANHFIYGLVGFVGVGLVFGVIVGVLFSALLGAAKEVYDRVTKKGTPDVLDFVATVAGGAVGYLCTYVS